MKPRVWVTGLCILLAAHSVVFADSARSPAVLDLRTPDGVTLKATYYEAGRPGPGILLLQHLNLSRKSWDEVARKLAAAGINTLTIDMRGAGESGGSYEKWDNPWSRTAHPKWQSDAEMAWQYLASQPGVTKNVMGLGGAGLDGVDISVYVARHHPAQLKSMVLISGETFQDGLDFLRRSPDLPELFVVADDDEYPPTLEAMLNLYGTATNPGRKLIRYPARADAPWLGDEPGSPKEIGKVPTRYTHGTGLFRPHPELQDLIVDWFVRTLITTPGYAPPDPVSAAPILNLIREPGGVAAATKLLAEAQKRNPKAELWPEVTLTIIALDHLRAHEPAVAAELLKLNLLAYPNSADIHDDLADAYLRLGQMGRARQEAQKSAGILAAGGPISSWATTSQYRTEIVDDIQQVLKKTVEAR